MVTTYVTRALVERGGGEWASLAVPQGRRQADLEKAVLYFVPQERHRQHLGFSRGVCTARADHRRLAYGGWPGAGLATGHTFETRRACAGRRMSRQAGARHASRAGSARGSALADPRVSVSALEVPATATRLSRFNKPRSARFPATHALADDGFQARTAHI